MFRNGIASPIGIVCLACLAGVAGCNNNEARDAAATLAANTGRLNDQIEAMTRSRRQIEVARGRLTEALELSTLTAQNRSERRLASWRILQSKGYTNDPYARRVGLFEAAREHTETAAAREAEIEALSAKLAVASEQAKGRRSEELTEAAKVLAALSTKRSLAEELRFLSGYVKTVCDSVEQAKKDAEAAAEAAKKKADEAKDKAKQESAAG